MIRSVIDNQDTRLADVLNRPLAGTSARTGGTVFMDALSKVGAEAVKTRARSVKMLDGDIIRRLVDRYWGITSPKDAERERRLLSDEFRKRMTRRRYLCRDDPKNGDELLKIAEWKAARQKPNVNRNNPDFTKVVTREAFRLAGAGNPGMAAQLLCYLQGVHVRMASAILTVYDPTAFTVMDILAWNALGYIGSQPVLDPPGLQPETYLGKASTYDAYLQVCRAVAKEHDVDLRTLDRCLWVMGQRKLSTKGKIARVLAADR